MQRCSTLLVRDDIPETLSFLTDTRDGASFTALIATDGPRALARVDQSTPDRVAMAAGLRHSESGRSWPPTPAATPATRTAARTPPTSPTSAGCS
jgi:hypothetical protein